MRSRLPRSCGGLLRRLLGTLCLLLMGKRRVDESRKQRMAITWGRGELRMELAADEPRVIWHLYHFHEGAVHGATCHLQARSLQHVQISVVDLVAMTMALDNHFLAIALVSGRILFQTTLLRAQPHRAAHVRVLVARLATAVRGGPLADQG